MRRGGAEVLGRNEIFVTTAELAAMGLCAGTGDHEECPGGGCLCGCHRLDPWPWETGDA